MVVDAMISNPPLMATKLYMYLFCHLLASVKQFFYFHDHHYLYNQRFLLFLKQIDMKNLLMTLLVPMLFSFSFSPVAEVTPPAKGKAVVYFARTSAMGMLFNFNFFDKDKFVGKFHSTGYLRYECEPGEHVFWARAENTDFITAELEADKIYFVLAEPHMALATVRVELRPIDPNNKKDENRVEKIVKLINKKVPDVTSPEEMAEEEKKKESIAAAIKTYEDNKKGKIDRLSKEMFYEKK